MPVSKIRNWFWNSARSKASDFQRQSESIKAKFWINCSILRLSQGRKRTDFHKKSAVKSFLLKYNHLAIRYIREPLCGYQNACQRNTTVKLRAVPTLHLRVITLIKSTSTLALFCVFIHLDTFGKSTFNIICKLTQSELISCLMALALSLRKWAAWVDL